MSFPDSYLGWNKYLLEYCMEHTVDASGQFTLAVGQMLDETDSSNAEAAFIASVRSEYARLLTISNDPVGLLIRRGEDGRPLCAAFLGAAVLAAEEMERNEYYKHLAERLGQRKEGSSVVGLRLPRFERCWTFLNEWLSERGACMHRPEQDEKRYVRWPKMHALLRLIDIKKLPQFFREYRLSPLRIHSSDEVSKHFSRWIESEKKVTPAGQRAWNDDVRQPAILRQILHVLERWDEEDKSSDFQPANALRRSYAWPILAIRDKKPYFYVRAPRREGFPERVDSGIPGLCWVGASEWYEDLPVNQQCLPILLSGFVAARDKYRVTLSDARILVFRLSEGGSGFEAKRENVGLPMNVPCAVFCRQRDEPRVSEYLNRICGSPPIRISFQGEFTLFHSIRAQYDCVPPLEELRVTLEVSTEFLGGLPTGRPWTWLEGYPPHSMRLFGRHLPSCVDINGRPTPLKEGECRFDGVLCAAGVYTVKVGERTWRLVIEPTQIRDQDAPSEAPALTEENFAQPDLREPLVGEWTLLGARPGEIAPLTPGRRPPFAPQWAVGRDPVGRRAAVAYTARPARPAPGRQGAADWADAILAAPAPRLGALNDGATRREVQEVWRQYVASAADVRRQRIRQARMAEERGNEQF